MWILFGNNPLRLLIGVACVRVTESRLNIFFCIIVVICVYSFWGFMGHTENSYSAVGVLARKMSLL